jgi:hypothetical protein
MATVAELATNSTDDVIHDKVMDIGIVTLWAQYLFSSVWREDVF